MYILYWEQTCLSGLLTDSSVRRIVEDLSEHSIFSSASLASDTKPGLTAVRRIFSQKKSQSPVGVKTEVQTANDSYAG